MFACQWAEFKFCTILLCTPPHWIWLQFSPLSITHCIGSALQLLFEAVHYITKVKHKKSKLPLARFSWCHMIHFLLPWCLPSWVESISVSVCVSIFVELDKYRNWEEQACLILDGKDHFPQFSKPFYVFAVWPDTAWKEGIFSGVEISAVIIVCANWSNFFLIGGSSISKHPSSLSWSSRRALQHPCWCCWEQDLPVPRRAKAAPLPTTT